MIMVASGFDMFTEAKRYDGVMYNYCMLTGSVVSVMIVMMLVGVHQVLTGKGRPIWGRKGYGN